jgi:hypothetical protein
LIKHNLVSLKKTNAVQDVSQSAFISLVVHIELTVACAHLDLAFTVLTELVNVVAQCSTTAEVGHVGLRNASTLLAHEDLQSFDVPVLLQLVLGLLFFGKHLALGSVWIATYPPLEFRHFLLFLLFGGFCLVTR